MLFLLKDLTTRELGVCVLFSRVCVYMVSNQNIVELE